MKLILPMSLILCASATMAISEDCSTYPYGVGIVMPDEVQKEKILSTQLAVVPMDSLPFKLDAINKATLKAKADIIAFWNDDLSRACTNGEAVETVMKNGTETSIQRTEVSSSVCEIRSKSQDIIRGAVVVGSCYTPGEMVLVTVGIKPETIAAAEAQRASTAQSLNRDDTNADQNQNSSTSGSTSLNINSGGGFSDTSRLKDF